MLKELFSKASAISELKAETRRLTGLILVNDDKLFNLNKKDVIERRRLEISYLQKKDDLNDKIYELESEIKTLEYEKEREINRIKSEASYEGSQLEERTNKITSDLKEDYDVKVKRIELEAQIKTDKAVVEYTDAFKGDIEGLNSTICDLTADTAAAIAENVVKDNAIELLEENIENYLAIISDLTKLLPKVDLTKFNINVDVPAPKVTVNTKSEK